MEAAADSGRWTGYNDCVWRGSGTGTGTRYRYCIRKLLQVLNCSCVSERLSTG
jgi:hypothetical protein